ncbi:ML domain-containing protein [Vararia minispora EC-137]|uniref:ML domain-containing protein n=1 Tax=Vararia minispora EC-137 TaxID=1314806 RepID=A0ACB8QW45_9AGAM|nr:ML domain-containing protein [Vararia minispora EC-137]
MLLRAALFSLTCALFVAAAISTQQETFRVDLLAEKEWKGDGWSYKDCSLETDLVQLTSVSMTPEPPKAGQNQTVAVKANILNVIEEGAYAVVEVKFGVIRILNRTFDICDEARRANASIQCPVLPGYYEIEQTVALPRGIPPSKFKASIRGYSVLDEDLLCGVATVDFSPFRH